MSKAEEFINNCTKNCSNQYNFPEYFENGIKRLKEYQPWLTPDQAKEAVEIAREEIYEWLEENAAKSLIHYLRQAMKDE